MQFYLIVFLYDDSAFLKIISPNYPNSFSTILQVH